MCTVPWSKPTAAGGRGRVCGRDVQQAAVAVEIALLQHLVEVLRVLQVQPSLFVLPVIEVSKKTLDDERDRSALFRGRRAKHLDALATGDIVMVRYTLRRTNRLRRQHSHMPTSKHWLW